MSKRLFGKNVSPCCSLCEKSIPSHNPDILICSIADKVTPFDSCKHFVYEPLKKTPNKHFSLPKYTINDFSLDID